MYDYPYAASIGWYPQELKQFCSPHLGLSQISVNLALAHVSSWTDHTEVGARAQLNVVGA